MKISVILCTYNRCRELPTALQSVAASQFPDPVEWEVIVVDNNSNDDTRAVVEDVSRRYPGLFRYVFESRAGKSFALNTGIREALGEIIAFVDDDLTVDPTWLHNLTLPLRSAEWAGVGGRTLPATAFTAPQWLGFSEPYNMGGILCALFDLGNEPQELKRAPYGANMAFRRAMFQKYGGFRTDLGPSPDRDVPRPNEDTEFGRRLMAGGERIQYAPTAVAYHPVPEDRIRRDYFLQWWFDYGRAQMREIGRRPDMWGIPRPVLSMLKYAFVLVPARAVRWLTSFDPKHRFYCKCLVWKTAGEIVELYRRSWGKAANRVSAEESRPPQFESTRQ